MRSTGTLGGLRLLMGLVVLLVLILSLVSCPPAGKGPAQTYAFYYAYGGGLSHPWPTLESLERRPLLGAYDSRDPEVVRKHMQWAQMLGTPELVGDHIKGFIISYRGWYDSTSQVVDTFFDISPKMGVRGSIMLEKPSGTRWQPYQKIDFADQDYWDALLWEIGQILQSYATRSLYDFALGKPVIVIRAQWNKDSMAELEKSDYDFYFGRLKERVAQEYGREVSLWGVDMVDSDAWDVYTEYNPYIRMDDFDPENPKVWTYKKTAASERSVTGGRSVTVASVIPGFAPPGPGAQAEGRRIPVRAKLYDELMKQAFTSYSDIIFVTSWNGWFEGTAIEPSIPPLGLIEPKIQDY